MDTKKYNYVVLIGVDGMGCFNKEANTPNLDKIFENGAVTYSGLSMNPTISAQNWGAMLIGAAPVVHGLTNSYISSHEYQNKELPTVFFRLREKYPDMKLCSVCNWNPINIGIIENGIGVKKLTAKNDRNVTDLAVKCIKERPELMFIHFDEVDGAGHKNDYGYNSRLYIKAVEKADGHIGRIYEAYKNAGIIDETLFMVIADHGGINRGHGGYTDAEKYIFFGVSGKGVTKGNIGTMVTADIASVILYAFGLEKPQYNENGFSSQIPLGIFEGEGENYFSPKLTTYIPKIRVTPKYNDKNGLSAFLPAQKTRLAMFFDNTTDDETKKCSFETNGSTKFYSTGIYGSYGEFGTVGSIKTNDLCFGSKSFTLAVWLKFDNGLTEDAVVCGTNAWTWDERIKCGFGLALRNHSTLFVLGNGKDKFDVLTPFPITLSDGWLHRTIAVDTENKEVRVYGNFKFIHKITLPDSFIVPFDRLPFTVGNDAENKQNNINYKLLINIDDLIIADGALTDSEVKALGEYYNL